MCDDFEGNVVKTRIINYLYKCKVPNYIVREKGFVETYIKVTFRQKRILLSSCK